MAPPACPAGQAKTRVSRTGNNSAAQRGFTLIEVLVVIGVLALVTALVLPLLSGTQAKADVEASARDLAAALRTTRSAAMTHGRSEALILDTANGAFRAGSSAERHVARGVNLVLVTATQEQIDQQTGDIRFFADGSSTGGGIRLAKGNARDQVLVDWLTGRVSIGDGTHAAR
jgi:general secretion pathway protein H